MKKKLLLGGLIIFASIIVSFSLFKQKSFASTSGIASPSEVQKALVCLVGQDYSSYLEFSGYEIIDNPVNFSICNSYRVKYQRDGNIYYKKVEVINQDTLSSLGYYQFNEIDFLPQSNHGTTLLAKTTEAQMTYLIYGFYDLEEDVSTGDAYLVVMENNVIVMEKYLYSTAEYLPKKILISENYITILGETKTNTGNIYFENYSHSGELVARNELIGEKADCLMDATILNEYLFIVGTTDSADHYYLGTRKGTDGFIMRFSLDTLVYQKIYVSNKEGYDKISKICTVGNNIVYVMQYISASTPYALLCQMNEELALTKSLTISMEIDFNVKYLKEAGGDIYLLSTCYSYNHSRIIGLTAIYNSSLRKVKDIYYTDEDFYTLNDLVSTNNQEFSVLMITKNENYEYGFTTIKYTNLEEIFRISQRSEGCLNSGYANVSGNQIYLHKNDRLTLFSITNLKVDNFGVFENETLKDYRVVINSKATSLDLKLSKINYNENMYGNYRLICAFSIEEITLLYYIEHLVAEDFNVRINEVYDIGYELSFNGIGYLNGKKIENGYIVNGEGNYTLEVYGNNNIKREINFQINYYKLEYQVQNETTLNNEKISIEKAQIESETSYQVIDNAKNQINLPRKNHWLIVIPFLSAISVAFIVIRFH